MSRVFELDRAKRKLHPFLERPSSRTQMPQLNATAPKGISCTGRKYGHGLKSPPGSLLLSPAPGARHPSSVWTAGAAGFSSNAGRFPPDPRAERDSASPSTRFDALRLDEALEAFEVYARPTAHNTK